MRRPMQKIRWWRVGVIGLACLVFTLAYTRQVVLLRLESNTVSILLQSLKGQPFSNVDESLRGQGRLMPHEEAINAAFDEAVTNGASTFYRLRGGVMARVVHDGEKILQFDIRKIEFK